MALIALHSGRPEESRNWIEKAVQEHDPNLFTIATDPLWRALKGLRECQSALREIGLVTAGRAGFEPGITKRRKP
jgi:hypothetical protein